VPKTSVCETPRIECVSPANVGRRWRAVLRGFRDRQTREEILIGWTASRSLWKWPSVWQAEQFPSLVALKVFHPPIFRNALIQACQNGSVRLSCPRMVIQKTLGNADCPWKQRAYEQNSAVACVSGLALGCPHPVVTSVTPSRSIA